MKHDTRVKYRFIVLCIFYFGLFYGCSYLIIALSTPAGLHNAWVADNINYVDAFRTMLLKCSSATLSVFNIANYTVDRYLKVLNGIKVHVNDSCLGIGILSLWWAIILSYPQRASIKLKYFATGTAIIVCLNILRITLLAGFLSSSTGKQFRHIDHHLLFNIVLYIFVALLLYKWLNVPSALQNADAPEKNDQPYLK